LKPDYLTFWTARPEINRIWFSTYTPQVAEQSEEILTLEQRLELARMLPELKRTYPALLLIDGMGEAIMTPPSKTAEFLEDVHQLHRALEDRIEPCFFGGNPDCSQCGCATSTRLHWVGKRTLVGN